jgi:serine/threonine protein phosphatase 1
VAGMHLIDARGPEGMRLYAIGDVHGRLDLLEPMHEQIRADIATTRPADWRILHLGDYTDRGPASKGVLDFLIHARERDERVVALMGNHDFGLLEFLAEPSPYDLFATNGGDETARSYGVELLTAPTTALAASAKALRAAIPATHIEFLRALPRSISFGDFFFCHAGVRPGVPLGRQDTHDLIWIRDEFLDHTSLYEKIVVHGHTPCTDPELMPNRVNIDTGAFFSGRLSALVIDGTEKMLMEVRGAPDHRY